jgi:uncharacterized protein
VSLAQSDLPTLLRCMDPLLHPGVHVFVSVPDGTAVPWQQVIAMVREPEGLTLVLAESDALELGLPILFRAAWITLKVHSDLQAVGLTAAFSAALGSAGISCNVLAGVCHDHIFVPADRAADAMAALQGLQRDSA